jgi:hypothetical protein
MESGGARITGRTESRFHVRCSVAAFAVLSLLAGCDGGPGMMDGGFGGIGPDDACTLSPVCPSYEAVLDDSGDAFERVETYRDDTFDPSTCPPGRVIRTKGRYDAYVRVASYVVESDHDGDGIVDHRARHERTYHFPTIISPLATETVWEDIDGDGIEEVRYHYVHPFEGDPQETFTVYVDLGDDSVVDRVYVSTTETVVDGSTRTVTSTQRQDLDGDSVDDVVSITVSVEVDGALQSSTTTVTATDPSLNSFTSTMVSYGVDTDESVTEVDLLRDGTIDTRWRYVLTRLPSGAVETRDERDDDADGTIDQIRSSRIETLATGESRVSYSGDDDGDGVLEWRLRYDSWWGGGTTGMWPPEGTRVWFDDDGDGLFERIYATYARDSQIVAREFGHELNGTLSYALYDREFCFLFSPFN